MLQWWRTAPRPVCVAATAVVVVLAYGSVVHLVQLVGSGFVPYPDLPGWLRTYFVALTVFDAGAAVLLARRTRTGVALAVAVLGTDAAANGWANYALDHSGGVTVGRVGQTVVTVLAIAAVAASPHLWRAASSRQRHR